MMKIGDRVFILNEKSEGIILKIQKDTLTVLNLTTDFEQHYLKKELILKSDSLEEHIKDQKISIKQEDVLLPEIKSKKEEYREVDLHFGHIVDRPKDYLPHQILDIQLNFARKAIEQARADKIKKLILIHGKGKGKLEEELYKLLKQEKNIEFYEADFKRYKLGAVEINFK